MANNFGDTGPSSTFRTPIGVAVATSQKQSFTTGTQTFFMSAEELMKYLNSKMKRLSKINHSETDYLEDEDD